MKEKIICISTPATKTYYQVSPLYKQFLDKDNNVVNTVGTQPDGEIIEIIVETKTIKHYFHGKLHGSLEVINLKDDTVSFREEYENGILTKADSLEDTLSSLQKEISKTQPNKGTIVRNSKGRHSFYINGQEIAEETLSTNGNTVELLGEIPDGEVTEFSENDKKCLIAHYRKNKLHGELIRYDESERIISKENYADGQLCGPAEYYIFRKDNTVTVKCTYKNSLLEGIRTARYDSGVLISQGQYHKGKLNGIRISYYSNGNKESEEEFNNGKLDGTRKIFFPSEKIWYTEQYTNGRLQGKRQSYFENGILRLEENYNDGVLDGERREYDSSGELLGNEEYHLGSLVHDTEVHKK